MPKGDRIFETSWKGHSFCCVPPENNPLRQRRALEYRQITTTEIYAQVSDVALRRAVAVV